MSEPWVERPDLWHCAACTTAYAVGLEACPQCGSTARAGTAASAPPAAAPSKEEVTAGGTDNDRGAK